MLNIVVPMAGLGSRFKKEGYVLPKPLIDVAGRPMIEVVIENLRPKQIEHRFIFICQKVHVDEYQIDQILQKIAPGSIVIPINGLTEGAACTVLLAEKYINNDAELMIANCDQYVDVDMDDYIQKSREYDGLIMTMKAYDNKWSFVKMSSQGLVTELREKEVISDEATVGIYNFKKGSDFCEGAKSMIARNERVNNEFYVAPVYNTLIADKARIGIYNIGSLSKGMYGIGVPEDLNAFLAMGILNGKR